ncbi:Meiotically up-regulated gene 154 protein [Lachnellula cervina]|uniref:Meiotically up-regulated gene 154 protein n=1 Tax=Lachnellula cervina TaxID=1316786 RepID=A0A7D8UP16_9HELO|nr:Meiotically up-regulated gene 154 protein [Lachnellula cervina]
MPRLIRRKPLIERVKDFINPADFLLWLSEEVETRDWDSKHFATPLALGLHIVLLIARANSGRSTSGADDVFGEDYSSTGWLSYIASFIVYLLTCFSIANAAYTFLRKRHYRLFESSIDTPQNTPSAHRVRVDSSPVSSSPLRLLTSILGDTSAESRAHPDPTRDVWEIAVWDPIPVCLRLFCLFSPGHVLVYWLFLPTLSSDPRPSMTVFTAIFLEVLLSSQLLLLQSAFSQQEKDSAIIHKEVMSEYDIKYVHPRLNPLVRDVGTQYTGEEKEGEIDTYTPTVILKRGFRTNPNPNYAKHVDPDNTEGITRQALSPVSSYTPSAYNSRDPTPFSGMTPRPPIRQPQFRQSIGSAISTGTSTGDGGSLGVYSHANSPLKKATSMYDIQSNTREPPRNSFEMAGREIQNQRERSHSPAKRQSEAPRSLLGLENDRRTGSPGGFGLKPLPGQQYNSPYRRAPSRFV